MCCYPLAGHSRNHADYIDIHRLASGKRGAAANRRPRSRTEGGAFGATMSETQSRSLTGKIARILFVLGLVVAGVAIGGIHTQALALASVIEAVACALAYLPPSARPFRSKASVGLLLGLGVALVVYTALTTVPLPAALVEKLAPATADVWARALRGFGEPGPALVPLSLDPIASRVEVLRGLTYLLVFLTAHRFTQAQEGTELLERVVVGVALFMAAASILHPVVGAEAVLGVYRPENAYGSHIAPILNANHLSGYLNLGLATGLGVLATSRAPRDRMVVLGVVLFLVGMELFVASRAGVASMILSAVIVGALHHRLKRGQREGLRITPILVGVALVTGIVLLVLAGAETKRAELGSRDLSKLETIRQAFGLVPSHFVFGIGRGAFESVFPAQRAGDGFYTVTHPENGVAQWATEWGVPLTVLAFVVLGRALSPRDMLARSRPPLGAYAALVGFAVHNLVDFSSELPGAMMLATVCAAIVTGGGADSTGTRAPRPVFSRRPRVVVGAILGATALALVVALASARHELYPDRTEARRLALDKSVPRATFDAYVRAASLRHPAEPFFPYLAALRGQVYRDGPVIAFAAQTLERCPTYGPVHLVLARTFFRRFPSQARTEYRLAFAQRADEGFDTEAPYLVHDFDEAMELVPDGPTAPAALDLLARALDTRLPATRARLDEELLRLDPTAEGALMRGARDVVLDLRQEAIWCGERRVCAERGLELARRLTEVSPRSCEGHALSAELHAAAGAPRDAVKELEEASNRVDDRTGCLVRLVALMEATGQDREIETTLDRVANAGCASQDECAENFAFAARTFVERGSPRRAVAFFRKAVERAPDKEELLLEYARLASDLELHGETLAAYSRLAELHPDNTEYAQRVAEEREAIARVRFGGGAPKDSP